MTVGSTEAVEVGPLAAIGDWPVDNAAAVVVTADGVRWAWGDGRRRFELASVTKTVVAYAALVAVEEGSLSLDLDAGPPGATVAHLLAHASGLAFEGGVIARPGTRRIYSNAGFEELGAVMAEATAISVDQYLAEAVLHPLGMSDTTLAGSPASAIASTAEDLAAFAAELLDPRLLAPATLRKAVTVAFAGLDGLVPGYGKQSPNNWGLGFEIRGHKDPHWTGTRNDPATFGHFGRSGTFLWVDPVARVALVVLTDREFEAWATACWRPLGDAVLSAL